MTLPVYPPPYHTEASDDRLFAAMDAIRHATLLLPSPEGPLVSFTPFFVDRSRRMLSSHIAARNPQAALLEHATLDVIFHGPHAYISPKLNDNDDVPTWNYVNVHVRGRARVVGDSEAKWTMMERFVRAIEGSDADAYLAGHESRLKSMLRAIVVFEMEIESVTGRFKLGRNDPVDLQHRTFAALRAETPPSLRAWLDTLAP